MPRKPKAAAGDQPPKKTTAVVRVEADIARMLSIISTATGEDVSDIVSPHLRPHVEKRYAEVIQQLGTEIRGKN